MKFYINIMYNLLLHFFVLGAFDLGNLHVDAAAGGISGSFASFNETGREQCSPCEKGRLLYALQRAWDLTLRPKNQENLDFQNDTFTLSGDDFQGQFESCDATLLANEEATWPFPVPEKVCDRLDVCTSEDDTDELNTRRRLLSCRTCCRYNICSRSKRQACLDRGYNCRRRLGGKGSDKEKSNNGNDKEKSNEKKIGNTNGVGVAQRNFPGVEPINDDFRRVPGIEQNMKRNLLEVLDSMEIVDEPVGGFASDVVSIDPP